MRSLVVYGTKYGSTEEVATTIGEVLRNNGNEVVVLELRRGVTPSLEDYDLVVIGTSIMMGSWNKSVTSFVKENQEKLENRRVALFICCGDLLDPERAADAGERYITEPLKEFGNIDPFSTALFGGVIDFSKYGFMVKTLMKRVMRSGMGDDFDISKPYDLRDWDRIRGFAEGLSAPQ